MNRTPQIKIRFGRLLLVTGMMIAILNGLAYADTTGTIMGFVTDRINHNYALNATISIKELNLKISLDSTNGLYEFWNIPAGSYTLVAEYQGKIYELNSKIVIHSNCRTWLDLEFTSNSRGLLYLDIKKQPPMPESTSHYPINIFENDIQPNWIITGKVFDKISGQPLYGATLSVRDLKLIARTNPVTGRYMIYGVPKGSHDLVCECPGYLRAIERVIIDSSASPFDKDIALIPNSETINLPAKINSQENSASGLSSTHVNQMGTIYGKIIDSETGRFIPGVTVVIDGKSFICKSNNDSGKYVFYDIPVGIYCLVANPIGYIRDSIYNVEVISGKETNTLFSLTNSTLHEPFDIDLYNRDVGMLTGRVSDSQTGKPVCDAFVQITNSNICVKVDNISGSYFIRNILPGDYTIISECLTYNPDSRMVTVPAGDTVKVDFRISRSGWFRNPRSR